MPFCLLWPESKVEERERVSVEGRVFSFYWRRLGRGGWRWWGVACEEGVGSFNINSYICYFFLSFGVK